MTEQLSEVADIGLLSLKFSVSQGAPLGDFLLAPACPLKNVSLWKGSLSTSGSETDEATMLQKNSFYTQAGNRSRTPCPKSSTPSTIASPYTKKIYVLYELKATPLH